MPSPDLRETTNYTGVVILLAEIWTCDIPSTKQKSCSLDRDVRLFRLVPACGEVQRTLCNVHKARSIIEVDHVWLRIDSDVQ
jgi:hypothetical protein